MARLTHYTSSNGQQRAIADMATPHLANALRKLERGEPHRVEEITALRDELNQRPDAGEFAQ